MLTGIENAYLYLSLVREIYPISLNCKFLGSTMLIDQDMENMRYILSFIAFSYYLCYLCNEQDSD